MTTFKQSAFVKVVDPEQRKELCEWLENIGYNKPETWADKSLDRCKTIRVDVDKVFRTPQCDVSHFSNDSRFIDCGTNIEMFRALATLRNDSVYGQWFISPGGCWRICSRGSWTDDQMLSPVWHKATPDEIVEHFKNKYKRTITLSRPKSCVPRGRPVGRDGVIYQINVR